MIYNSLLISDLDETLQSAHGIITDKQAKIIEKIIEKGTLVTIVSGASVKSITDRVVSRINPYFYKSMIFYANNGGICFQVNEDMSHNYFYNHASEFMPYKPEIVEMMNDYFAAKGMGETIFIDGTNVLENRICIEDKESQLTITLKGLENTRNDIVNDLSLVMRAKFGDKIVIFSAGSKSIDILMSKTSKHHAVQHLLQNFPDIIFSNDRKVIIAGDSFHKDGQDIKLLHPSLRGATVFCAGNSAPDTSFFVIVRASKPSSDETYEFLIKEFEI